MPRRGQAERRDIPPDPKFGSRLVQRFINKVMLDGKKSVAERCVYGALDLAEQQQKKPALDLFEQAIRNATPILEVKPRRVGGATYQVPIEIRGERRTALAIRWLIQSARNRSGRTFAEKLAAELSDAAHGQGATIKKREDTHRMAD